MIFLVQPRHTCYPNGHEPRPELTEVGGKGEARTYEGSGTVLQSSSDPEAIEKDSFINEGLSDDDIPPAPANTPEPAPANKMDVDFTIRSPSPIAPLNIYYAAVDHS